MERPSHAGLRHLALNARDLTAMKQFYVDVLGFAVEWEPDADNVYLSSGVDNLALHRSAKASRSNDGASHSNEEPSRSKGSEAADDEWSARLQPSESPLDHLGLIVRTADDVDRWAAFVESRGIALDAQPKTHRDGARSCYFSDPDGNKVQIIHHPPIAQKV